jgi:hypothetical protein
MHRYRSFRFGLDEAEQPGDCCCEGGNDDDADQQLAEEAHDFPQPAVWPRVGCGAVTAASGL